MKTNLTIVFCVFFIAAKIAAQTTTLQGKVTNLEDIEGIHVLNNNSRNNSVTDAFGNFSIRAKVSDTLVFSSVHYLPQKVEVTQAIVESGIVVVTLEKLVKSFGRSHQGYRGYKSGTPHKFFRFGYSRLSRRTRRKNTHCFGTDYWPHSCGF